MFGGPFGSTSPRGSREAHASRPSRPTATTTHTQQISHILAERRGRVQDGRRPRRQLLFLNHTGLDVKVRKSKGGGRQSHTREADDEDQAESEAIAILNENQAELIPSPVKKVVDQRVLKAVEDPESKQTEEDLNFMDVELEGLGEISGIPMTPGPAH